MVITSGTNQTNFLICICKDEFFTDFPQTYQQSSRGKIFLNMLIYFEERAGYNIIIKKYQSVMLIEVINYDDKNIGTPSSKS